MSWVKRGQTPHAESDPLTGQYVLSYSKRYRWTVALFTLLTIGFLALGIAGLQEGLRFVILYYVIFTPLAAYMLLGFRDAFYRPIRFNESGLFAGSGARAFIPWNTITAIRYRKHFGWAVISTQTGHRVYITNYRNGLYTLGSFVRRTLGQEKASAIFQLAGIAFRAAE